MPRIYLDSNASTPVRPEVVAAMMPVFTEDFGNASSIHWFGQQAKALIDEARQHVAKLIHAETSEIVFVSGGTEADNLAIRGIAESQKVKGRHIITSKIEHHAVMHTCKDLEKQGFEVTWVNVSRDGVVDPDDVKRAIRPDTILISIMHANNEIGTIQEIAEIGNIAEEADIYFHSDGVQSTEKIPVDVKTLKVDLYSISAHKIHGPKGVGALFVKKGAVLKPLMTGGGHERNRRSGTENVPGIAGVRRRREDGSRSSRDGGRGSVAGPPGAWFEREDRTDPRERGKCAADCPIRPTSWWIMRRAKGW